MDESHTQQTASVIPLLPKDQYRPLDNLRSQLFFIVREELDGKLLQASLDTLIRDHLPILEARVKDTGPNKALEYHLPRSFTSEYRLFGWSTSTVNESFSNLNLLGSPPQPDAAITWGTRTPELERLWAPADWPTERKHERPDCPLFLVHLTTYTDFAVVATSLPHAVADQMGYASVIEAWLDIAQGKTPTPFLSLEETRDMFDTMSRFSDQDLRKKGQYRLKSFLDRSRVILSHAAEVIWEQEEERRTMLLSEESVARLKRSFQAEIRTRYGADAPSLSSNDAVTGILTKASQSPVQARGVLTRLTASLSQP